MNARPFFARYGFTILVLFAIAAPWLLEGAARAVQSNQNRVQDWLPASFRETGDLAWFRRHFAGDQFIIISWDGCRISGVANPAGDDPRIEELAQRLERDANRTDESGQPLGPAHSWCKSVTTARRLLTKLTNDPGGIRFDVALQRLHGNLVGSDGRTSCVIALLRDEAIPHFREILGRGSDGHLMLRRAPGSLFTTLAACGIPLDAVHLGGPPVDNVAIDEEGERTLVRLAALAGLLGLGLAWWSLRSIKLTAIVYSCGILSAMLSLSAIHFTHQKTDAILLSMPALVFVLTISGAIHLINHYREEVEAGSGVHAVGRALRHGWKPAFLCSLTTAFGLLSLRGSDLVPIRKFGTYSALGVLLSLVVLFIYLPAALQFWRPQIRRRIGVSNDALRSRESSSGERLWGWFGHKIIAHHRLVTASCAVVIGFAAWGLNRVSTTIDLLKLFDDQATILRDYRWLEGNIGRLVPMELAIRIAPEACSAEIQADKHGPQRLALVDRIGLIKEIQARIERELGRHGSDLVGPSLSAATFVPPFPARPRGVSGVVRRVTLNSQLQQSYADLQESGYLATDAQHGDEIWRISLRVAAFKDVDYGAFTRQLEEIVDPLVSQQNALLGSGDTPFVKAVYTGVVPIVYKAQRALLESLIASTVWSFLTITPLMMLVSRGIRTGLVTMLPNILPVLVIFGGMGWLGLEIDIGSMMSASIALGVAVDDTIHYLTWFRDALQTGVPRNDAILNAYRRCAAPTLQASLINGLGLSVFALSTFTPTKQFGLLMLTILIAGVVAELVLLPALLAGPLGVVFEQQRRRTTPSELGETPDDRMSAAGLLAGLSRRWEREAATLGTHLAKSSNDSITRDG